MHKHEFQALRWLELDDDGRIMMTTDYGEGCDQDYACVPTPDHVPDRLVGDWHELDAERRLNRRQGRDYVEAVSGYRGG